MDRRGRASRSFRPATTKVGTRGDDSHRLLQGDLDLEYIIMDGGSTDVSVEIIKEQEPWLRYWVSE
jgi:hypothetical protein